MFLNYDLFLRHISRFSPIFPLLPTVAVNILYDTLYDQDGKFSGLGGGDYMWVRTHSRPKRFHLLSCWSTLCAAHPPVWSTLVWSKFTDVSS